MTAEMPPPPYPVLVTKDDRGFKLRVEELLVSARAPDLGEAWRLLQARVQEVVQVAEHAGIADELPSRRSAPPLLASTIPTDLLPLGDVAKGAKFPG